MEQKTVFLSYRRSESKYLVRFSYCKHDDSLHKAAERLAKIKG